MAAGLPPNLPMIQGAGPGSQGPMPPPTPPAPPPAAGPQGMGGDLQQMLLYFLAGVGFPHFEATVNKLRKDPNAAAKGVKKDAAQAPQQQMNPMIAMMLAKAAAANGGMPGGMVPPPQGLPPIGGM